MDEETKRAVFVNWWGTAYNGHVLWYVVVQDNGTDSCAETKEEDWKPIPDEFVPRFTSLFQLMDPVSKQKYSDIWRRYKLTGEEFDELMREVEDAH